MAKNQDFETSIGTGGETHQQVPKKGPHSKKDTYLTTNQGICVSDCLAAGQRTEAEEGRIRPARNADGDCRQG